MPKSSNIPVRFIAQKTCPLERYLRQVNTHNAEKPLTPKQIARDERAKAIGYLRGDYLKAGDTVYAILRHVSKSGMRRWVDLYCINAQSQPLRITWNAAKALAMRYDKRRDALCVEGAGFDAAHSIVHDLAWTLFGNCDSLTGTIQ